MSLRVRQIVLLLCTGIFISKGYSADSDQGMFKPPCYYRVFTPDIYDQTEILASVKHRIDTHTISESELDGLFVAHLYASKESQVKQTIMGKLRTRITCLEKEAVSEDKKALLQRFLGVIAGA